MNSRDRILLSLEHKEPDRVPYDLAGTHVTGIHVTAYKNLCNCLGVESEPIEFADVVQQIVVPSREIMARFEVDTRGLYPLCSHNWNVVGRDIGDYYEYIDEWGFTQHKPKIDGHYWSLVKSPISGMMTDAATINNYAWPVPDDPRRIAGLRQLALRCRAEGKAVIMKGLCAGLFEMAQRVRGMENLLCDLLADQATASALLDKLLEIKMRFWKMALEELGDVVDIVVETDDYGTQDSQLISHDTFKEMIYPRLRILVEFIKTALGRKKANGEKGYLFFHSCGNVRPFIGDFIDIGIDIINPVHISAAGMEPVALKRDFGKFVTFWGGGVETQSILPKGTVQQVREDVKRNIEALMPNGGYVFNTVHNIQADVPPQNIAAMWQALRDYGIYSYL